MKAVGLMLLVGCSVVVTALGTQHLLMRRGHMGREEARFANWHQEVVVKKFQNGGQIWYQLTFVRSNNVPFSGQSYVLATDSQLVSQWNVQWSDGEINLRPEGVLSRGSVIIGRLDHDTQKWDLVTP